MVNAMAKYVINMTHSHQYIILLAAGTEIHASHLNGVGGGGLNWHNFYDPRRRKKCKIPKVIVPFMRVIASSNVSSIARL